MKLSSDYDEIISRIESLHKKGRALQGKAMVRSDLSVNEFSLLQLISQRENGVTQAEAASALAVDKALISRLTRSLAEKGLLIAAENPDCRREKRLTLTETSGQMLPRLAEGHYRGVAGLFGDIEQEELRAFGSTLDKILENMEKLEKDGKDRSKNND